MTTTDKKMIQNMDSRTTKHSSGCGALYVTIDLANGVPKEVFIQNTGCGCPCSVSIIARLITKNLRGGESIESIAHTLRQSTCEECVRMKAEGKSCWDMVANEIMRFQKPTANIKLKSPF